MCRNPVGEGAKRVTTCPVPALALAIPFCFLFKGFMATRLPLVPLGEEPADAALQQPHWRMRARLSSIADAADAALAKAGFDRGPWLAIAFAGGIAMWFALDGPVAWVVAASACL